MPRLNSRPFSAEIQLNHLTSERPSSLARRPHNVQDKSPAPHSGQSEILGAIAELRKELFKGAGQTGAGHTESGLPQTDGAASENVALRETHQRDLEDARLLRTEMEKLSVAIDTTKREIASMRFKDSNRGERIIDVTHELDEVVLDTERATNGILSACEEIEKHAEAISLQASSAEDRAEIDALSEKVIQIYEACNFQDITGQRISKVVNTLKFIEQRLEVMMGIWGGNEAFAAIELPETQVASEDDLLLNGPARSDSESVNQTDIDALFD
ncbi:MAG: hypothetical protein EXR08_09260 [Alphaproteobacteria bacterium]|nr:hypothetical protein [Alphaproteobacteria bacterium]